MISSITLAKNARSVLITSTDGTESEISASMLRSKALDSASRRELIQHGRVCTSEDLTITGITSMGSTGLNICFSDGHERAIYPYRYLSQLAFHADN